MHTAQFTLRQCRTLVAYRPSQHAPEWGGNWFLLDDCAVSPEDIASRTLERFSKLRRPYAFGVTRSVIDNFIAAGLRTRFTPKAAEREPQPEVMSLLDAGANADADCSRLASGAHDSVR